MPWLTYGAIGALVGLVVGRPIWSLLRDKNATAWISILKAAFGFGIGCGLYAVVSRAWNPSALVVGGYNIFSWPVSLGGAIGAIYGGFVELDDAIGDDKKPASLSSGHSSSAATPAGPSGAAAKKKPAPKA